MPIRAIKAIYILTQQAMLAVLWSARRRKHAEQVFCADLRAKLYTSDGRLLGLLFTFALACHEMLVAVETVFPWRLFLLHYST
jgi:hypothetical protein